MTCPFQTPRASHFICTLAGDIRGGATIAVAPSVCDQCHREWIGNVPPTLERLTPTLRQICGETIETMKPRGECFHRSSQPIDRTDHGEPCNCPNRWLYRCEHPIISAYDPTTRLAECQNCPGWEPVYPDEEEQP